MLREKQVVTPGETVWQAQQEVILNPVAARASLTDDRQALAFAVRACLVCPNSQPELASLLRSPQPCHNPIPPLKTNNGKSHRPRRSYTIR